MSDKPKTPEDTEESSGYLESILGFPPLVISTGDDLSGLKWTKEDKDKLREVVIEINEEKRL